jgi:hypothetical protein
VRCFLRGKDWILKCHLGSLRLQRVTLDLTWFPIHPSQLAFISKPIVWCCVFAVIDSSIVTLQKIGNNSECNIRRMKIFRQKYPALPIYPTEISYGLPRNWNPICAEKQIISRGNDVTLFFCTVKYSLMSLCFVPSPLRVINPGLYASNVRTSFLMWFSE